MITREPLWNLGSLKKKENKKSLNQQQHYSLAQHKSPQRARAVEAVAVRCTRSRTFAQIHRYFPTSRGFHTNAHFVGKSFIPLSFGYRHRPTGGASASSHPRAWFAPTRRLNTGCTHTQSPYHPYTEGGPPFLIRFHRFSCALYFTSDSYV